jgi:hypothetical protein
MFLPQRNAGDQPRFVFQSNQNFASRRSRGKQKSLRLFGCGRPDPAQPGWDEIQNRHQVKPAVWFCR